MSTNYYSYNHFFFYFFFSFLITILWLHIISQFIKNIFYTLFGPIQPNVLEAPMSQISILLLSLVYLFQNRVLFLPSSVHLAYYCYWLFFLLPQDRVARLIVKNRDRNVFPLTILKHFPDFSLQRILCSSRQLSKKTGSLPSITTFLRLELTINVRFCSLDQRNELQSLNEGCLTT